MNILLVVATSLDGYIAEETSQISTDWTSKKDKQFFKDITTQAGVVIFGRTTFETIGRPLPNRRLIVLSRQKKENEAGVEWSQETPKELIARLAKEGVTSVVVGGGSRVYADFLQEHLVDEVYVSVHPYLFGGGVPFVASLASTIALAHLSTETWDDGTVLLRYRVHRTSVAD